MTVLICEVDNAFILFGRAYCVELEHVVCTMTHFLVVEFQTGNIIWHTSLPYDRCYTTKMTKAISKHRS